MKSSPAAIDRVFVYGTLKTGQIRESAWPHQPQSVQQAWTRGKLFDLGDYPAMLPGQDRIAGEVWTFEPHEMAATLEVLDEIEGYFNNPDDLYRRVIVTCILEAGSQVDAYTYHYRHESLTSAWRIHPKLGHCSWPNSEGAKD